ncbi:MAG: HD domain-containing protein, partial [Planctomycetia bacterium]|nr:HD domain-containing protein [Planctomycetia bacterium]
MLLHVGEAEPGGHLLLGVAPGRVNLLQQLPEGASDELVTAALLHDLGHLLHDLGEDIADRGVDSRHERVGANQLERWFGPEVVEPIRMHADSKRYLCWKEAGYFGDLSAASKQSLALQGGPML